jgi:phosphoribosyl 1,2-cyclic phosphate phosphodiesterase
MSRAILTILGTSALGVPSFYCGCKACAEARANPELQRGCCGLAIQANDGYGNVKTTLIDTSPDLRMQLIRENIEDVARVLFTHEHFDHVGGLPQLEYYLRLKAKTTLPLFAGSEAISVIKQQFSFLDDILEYNHCQFWQQLNFEGVSYSFLPATHCAGAFGFVIAAQDGHGPEVAYFPDTAAFAVETRKQLQNIDILIIDSSFNGNNWLPDAHHSIDQAIAVSRELNAGQTYLTHLAMHYDTPITTQELNAKLAVYEGKIQAAYDGQQILL